MLMREGKQQKRRRRHHTVPRFHLRGFASDDGMLRQVDLITGDQRRVSIADASVLKDFYTILLDDGSRSDVWERRLADIENRVAPLVRTAINAHEWQPTPQQRAALAGWIALQFLRGPDHRRTLSEMRSLMLQMTVGMGGLAYLRHVMAEGLRREVTITEAEAVWDDIHSPDGPTMKVSGEEHFASIQAMAEQGTRLIASRSWHRVRFQRRTLAINDSPVALIPAEDHPHFRGVGLANAGAVTVALDRRTLLWLADPWMPDFEFPPSTVLARAHNRSVVFGAERFVYSHPDDSDPTDGLLPRPPRQRIGVDSLADFANRDRPLDDVLAQIAENERNGDPDSITADYTWPIPGYEAPSGAIPHL